jgi:hypothetical protein
MLRFRQSFITTLCREILWAEIMAGFGVFAHGVNLYLDCIEASGQ